jgi:D-inositol-3-phosphate glycosyltransferase
MYVKGLDIAYKACEHAEKLLTSKKSAVQLVRLNVRGVSSSEAKELLGETEARVTCFGFGSQEEVKEDLWSNHLFIMPSRSEPFGLVATEAIATEIPVLVSNQSGVAKLLTSLGMLNEVVQTTSRLPEISEFTQACSEKDIILWGQKIAEVAEHYEDHVQGAKDLRTKLSAKIDATRPYESFINQGYKDLMLPPMFS